MSIKEGLIIFFATWALPSFWIHAHISLALLATLVYLRFLYGWIEKDLSEDDQP